MPPIAVSVRAIPRRSSVACQSASAFSLRPSSGNTRPAALPLFFWIVFRRGMHFVSGQELRNNDVEPFLPVFDLHVEPHHGMPLTLGGGKRYATIYQKWLL